MTDKEIASLVEVLELHTETLATLTARFQELKEFAELTARSVVLMSETLSILVSEE